MMLIAFNILAQSYRSLFMEKDIYYFLGLKKQKTKKPKQNTLGPKYLVERRHVYQITTDILLFIQYLNKYL